MQDPVCGMEVTPARATLSSFYDGQTYVFCARACKEQFDKAPEQYVRSASPLARYAHALYDALSTLGKVFHGSALQAESLGVLSPAEWEALRLLGQRGECKMREIATACTVALSTATGIIDRLVKKGLVQRRHSRADRRIVLGRLTGRGQLLYEQRLDADMRLVLNMLQALQEDEQEALVRLMQKIIHCLPPVPQGKDDPDVT